MIECRGAEFEEMPLVARLRAQMAAEMGGDWDVAHPGWRTRFAQYFGGRQRSAKAQAFLAFDGADAVGCLIVSVADDYRSFVLNLESAHVNAVYVRPSHRRAGIATQLIRLAIRWARARGCVRMRLRSSDAGRGLYESLGFRAGREMEMML